MKKQTLYLLVGLYVLLQGCSKPFYDTPENTPMENFNALWKTIDEKYSFFEYKKDYVNWDKVKADHIGKIKAEMTDEELATVFASMLDSLYDGHVNLISSINTSNDWNFLYNPILPLQDKEDTTTSWWVSSAKNGTEYRRNFDVNVVRDLCLGPEFVAAGGIFYSYINTTNGHYIEGAVPVDKPTTDYVVYMYYSSFVNDITYLEKIIEDNKDNPLCKGFIFDTRDNGGGAISNAELAVNLLTPTSVADKVGTSKLVLKVYSKSGPGHTQFSEPSEIKAALKKKHDKPVVVLINQFCFSSGSLFPAGLRFYSDRSATSKLKMLGKKTRGGGGSPADYTLPNGWHYRFTTNYFTFYNKYSTKEKEDDKWELFENGVRPDIYLPHMDATTLYTQGPGKKARDLWIELSIQELLKAQ